MASSGGDMVNVPENYPVGTRVLAVDADTIALTTLKQMLQRCGYLVTAKTSAEEALREVRDKPEGTFDLVMSELNTRGRMDGFGLLRRLHDRIPVIIFSTGDAVPTVRRVVDEGACSYLQKPLRMEEIRNIWQHVVRRRGIRAPTPRGADAPSRQDHGDKEKTTTTTTRKRGADDYEEDHHGRGKKPKFQWSPVLHALFTGAVKHLKGKEEITPKRIKDLLGREGEHVTQDQVASHLQKYRKDCQNALSANASSSHANVYKNYLTPQDIEESFTYFRRSQGGTIDHGSIIRQTSLHLADDTLSVGYGFLGNGSYTASYGGVLANDESLVSAVARAVKGTTTGHGGVHTNKNLVTASLPSNLAQPQQPMSSGFPTNFISTYDPNLAQPQQPMSSNFPTNFISTYDPNLAQPQPMSSNFPTDFISTYDRNLAQPQQPMSSGFPTNYIPTYDPNLAQPQQPMTSGFPTNFIFPVTHEGLSAQQTSQLCYVDDGSMLPWSELGRVDDDPLMSSLLGGDEATQDARTLDMSQVMHDFGTTGEIRGLQPECLNIGFFSVESTNGTTSTSGGGGVLRLLTDGTMADQFEDELEKFINPNMQ